MKKLLSVFAYIGIVCLIFFHVDLKAQAHEIQMEKREKTVTKVQAEFDIDTSESWSAEGETIKSYDVSEGEQIAIAFSNSTIAVFDRDMQFQYEISFETSGSYGVLWNGENVMFVDVRSDIAVEFDESGNIVDSYEITGPSNWRFEILSERVRKIGGYKYLCTNQTVDMPSTHFNYYTQLKKYDMSGAESVIYESEQKIDGIWYGILVLLGFGVVGVMTAIVMGICFVKEMKKEEQRKGRKTNEPTNK